MFCCATIKQGKSFGFWLRSPKAHSPTNMKGDAKHGTGNSLSLNYCYKFESSYYIDKRRNIERRVTNNTTKFILCFVSQIFYFRKISNFLYRSEERRVGKECR